MMMEKEKVFFNPGETVTLRQELPNRPEMVVESVEKSTMKVRDGISKPILFGIKCIWFDSTGRLCEHRFNTKDLIHVEQRRNN